MNRQRTAKDPKIVVHYLGGLGNQLFQFFFAQELSRNTGRRITHDFSALYQKKSHHNSDIRNFRDLFNGSENIARNNSFFRLRNRILVSISLRHLFPVLQLGVIRDLPRWEIEPNSSPLTTLRLIGYFQSIKHYESWKNRFSFDPLKVDKISGKAKSLMKYYAQIRFIAIHIRGGDFLNDSATHANLDHEYYSGALQSLEESDLRDLHRVIFTNDQNHAITVLNRVEISNYTILEDVDLSAAEILGIMSLADGHVISNSTFSYWGAILSKFSKLVIYPSSIRLIEQNLESNYPDSWIRI